MRDKNFTVRERILGGLFGKAVGGTLGQPCEGLRGPLFLDRYTPEPTEMQPNDDLDLQILWICKITTDWKGVLSRKNFAKAWIENVHFYVDEYAVAIRNIEKGIYPPLSGQYDNAFTDGLGAAIRSEIWAFLAPNDPETAVKYAKFDAEVDHYGDGYYAELFLTSLESLAFGENDIMQLIEKGLKFIPENCRLAQAVRDTIKWCSESDEPLVVRRNILRKYGSPNFTDVVMNIPFMIMALILGKGVFGKSICLANNCGRDADCTAATVGAILGIIDPDSIEEQWLKPIGRNLVVSKEIIGINPPATLDELTDLIMEWQGKIVCDDTLPVEPNWKDFEIHAETGVSVPKSRGDISREKINAIELTDVTFKGNLNQIDLSDLQGDSFRIFEMKMHVPYDGRYAFIVAATCRCLVWLNDELQFGHSRGDFVPSTNRPHINQNLRMFMKKGTYNLSIALSPYDEEQLSTPLFFCLANHEYKFILGAFDRDNNKNLKGKE